jgi:hypothetical protein
VRQPPSKSRYTQPAPVQPISFDQSAEWIIVAPRNEADVVDHILERAEADGIRRYRVLWADRGPIRFYSSAEDLWRDIFPS